MLVVGLATPAFAQSKAALSGLVKDAQGGGIPGATVKVKSIATGVETSVMTNGTGNWGVPSLDIGTYEVTVELTGFKTMKYDKVQLSAGQATDLKTVLEVGGVTDVIKVTAQTQLVETANTNVTTTISADMMNNLPQVTKNALNFVTFLPGVNASSTHQQRSSTIVGLPPSALAVTLDGVNVQDQYLKDTSGSSFFAIVRPQTDLIEEVTVSEATPGADSSAGGAVQIKFVTRSGSNQPNGSAYEYLRHPALNTNSFSNTSAFGTGVNDLTKNPIIVNQYGFREGGPIVIPGLYDGHGKAFYFFNYEEFRLPSAPTRTRQVLSPLAQSGMFEYGCPTAAPTNGGGCGNTKSLFAIASAYAAAVPATTLNGVAYAAGSPVVSAAITGANGVDPTILTMMTTINNITGLNNYAGLTGTAVGVQPTNPVGTLSYNNDQNIINYKYQPGSLRAEHIPGGRADFNITSKQRLSATYQFQKVNSNPDTLNGAEAPFPGLANHGAQYSFRNSGSATLRSTLTANLVNEGSWGFLWDPVNFFTDITTAQFDLAGIPGQSGTGFPFSFAYTPTNFFTSNNHQGRNGSNWQIRDTLSWLKGKHSLSFGFNYTKISGNDFNYNILPNVDGAIDTQRDPVSANTAGGMFTTVFFPGANNTELGSARAMYAMLTGRITSISGSSTRNADGSYTYQGPGQQLLHQSEAGFFAQDQWHLKSNITLNLGVRYELQFPIQPDLPIYATNVLGDICGQSGAGPTNPKATEAALIGLPCQFGVPGFAAGQQAFGVSVPFVRADGSSACMTPGTNNGVDGLTAPPCWNYQQYNPKTSSWNTDWNNFGPSIGVAWQPNVQHGIGRKLLGDPALATVRASYARSFNTVGISTLEGEFSHGPGRTFNSTRNTTNLNLCGDATLNCFPFQYTPALLAGQIGAPPNCTSTAPSNGCVPVLGLTYPRLLNFTSGPEIFDPNYQTSYSDSYSVGLQRALSKDMSIEVRYIRTRNYGGSTTRNFQEQNIFTAPFGTSTNFLQEYQQAQVNLAINLAKTGVASFAPKNDPATGAFYTGQGGLPMMLASYQGVSGGTGGTGCGLPSGGAVYLQGGSNATSFCPNAALASSYTTSNWTNTSNIQALSMLRPNISQFSFGGTSSTNDLFFNPTFRANGVASGMPINFWVMNPDAGGSTVLVAQGFTKYDSIQLILNRRLSRGLQVNFSYAYQTESGSSFETFFKQRQLVRDNGAPPNSYKLLVNYDLPVGKGKRFGTNMPTWLDGIIGNWQLNMTMRLENGSLVDIGNVELNHMNLQDVKNMFHYYRDTTPQPVNYFCVSGSTVAACTTAFAAGAAVNTWQPGFTTPSGRWLDLPLDVIINTQRAWSVDPSQPSPSAALGLPAQYTKCSGGTTVCGGPDPNARFFSEPSTLKVDATTGAVTGCSAIFATDCGIRQRFINAPLFSRFEMSAKKRFPFARRGSFDIEVDALNLFNAIDFNNAFSSSTGSGQIGSVYSDVSNTFDPGGRLIQLVFRVNW